MSSQIHTKHGILIHDLTASSNLDTQLHLRHDSEIVNNYEMNTIKIKNEESDLEGYFYSLENDQQYSDIEYKFNTLRNIKEINNKILDFFKASKIGNTLIGIITTIIII